MALSPDQYARFDRNVDLKTIMAIVAARLGRDVADSLATDALEISDGRRPAPDVVWPKF